MKKIFFKFFLSAMIILLSSCKNNVTIESMKATKEKESVKEFMSLLKDFETDEIISSYGDSFKEENCFNVTPSLVSEQTDMKIFKFSDSCASFVMMDNEIYYLCDYFGGYGFVNAVPCDFDNDGNKDLLVASSSGSGVHRSSISIFNSLSKEYTVIYSALDTDLIVDAVKNSYVSEEFKVVSLKFLVHSAEIDINNNNIADLSFVSTGVIGSIEVENGSPTFIPYQ